MSQTSDPYPTVAARRRAIAGWCLYDFANSAYTTLIITLVFSIYFREVVVGAEDNSGDRLWGLANFAAMLCVALGSPVVGAMADHAGLRRPLLALATLQAVIATALLATTGPGGIVWAFALYVLGTIGFEVGYVFYNAFLGDLAPPERVGRISGWGWAVGYAGGLAALLLCYPLIGSDLHRGGALDAVAIGQRRMSFLVVAVFYLVFALPALLWLREPRRTSAAPSLRTQLSIGLGRVRQTLGHLRDYRQVGTFVLASLFFNDGITTVITFSAIYATTTFGFSSSELRWLFIAMNVIAFPGALVAGYVADAVGARRTLVGSLALWIGVVLLGGLASGKPAFWVMAAGAALGMGSTQAVARSFMTQISPPERAAEFFGFYSQAGKLASMFGPLLFGLISHRTGSQRVAVLSLLPFFVIGLLLTLAVDEGRARREAAGAA